MIATGQPSAIGTLGCERPIVCNSRHRVSEAGVVSVGLGRQVRCPRC
jgi:hypothetical protein